MKQELREAVFERDRYCVKCGQGLREPVAVHHRKLKSQGGRDELANLVALCSPCHNIAPDSVHQNPAISMEKGYIVPSWAQPNEWALTLPDGRRVLLENNGTYIEIGVTNGW